VVAGARRSAQEVEGVAGAIQELGRSGGGGALLWLVAAGLLTFAAFSVVEAWLRRVP
jgi:Na+/alanine symporter